MAAIVITLWAESPHLTQFSPLFVRVTFVVVKCSFVGSLVCGTAMVRTHAVSRLHPVLVCDAVYMSIFQRKLVLPSPGYWTTLMLGAAYLPETSDWACHIAHSLRDNLKTHQLRYSWYQPKCTGQNPSSDGKKYFKYSRNWRFGSSDHWIVSRASWAQAHFFWYMLMLSSHLYLVPPNGLPHLFNVYNYVCFPYLPQACRILSLWIAFGHESTLVRPLQPPVTPFLLSTLSSA
jgi:hypothetical protein